MELIGSTFVKYTLTFLKTVRSWETYKTKILSDAVNTQKGKYRIKKNFESFCMKNYNRSMEEVIQEMKLAEEDHKQIV